MQLWDLYHSWVTDVSAENVRKIFTLGLSQNSGFLIFGSRLKPTYEELNQG
jgi:hypothetical protein